MIFNVVALLAAVAAMVDARNPEVVSPKNSQFKAGETMQIKWAGGDTGYVNIDIVGDSLSFPLVIASVPSANQVFDWVIPTNLKSASNYQIRVWGDHQPTDCHDGLSNKFAIVNEIPNAVTGFVVLAPNAQQPCETGRKCKISWDYNPNSMYPAMVDIDVHRVGSTAPVMHVATVSSSLKCFEWEVPNDPTLRDGQLYISVNGQGIPLPGPGQSNDMGGNTVAFVMNEPKPEEPKKDDKKEKKIKEPRKMEPKVRGNEADEKNAAANVMTAGGLSFAAVAAVAIASLFL